MVVVKDSVALLLQAMHELHVHPSWQPKSNYEHRKYCAPHNSVVQPVSGAVPTACYISHELGRGSADLGGPSLLS